MINNENQESTQASDKLTRADKIFLQQSIELQIKINKSLLKKIDKMLNKKKPD